MSSANQTIDSETAELLKRFSGGVDLESRLKALQQLINKRVVASVKKSPDFLSGMQFLSETALNGSSEARIRAIAFVSKVWSISGMESAQSYLKNGSLDVEIAPLDSLSDSGERSYVAKALALSEAGWVRHYAAVWTVRETGPAVRRELANLLVGASTTLEDVFVELAMELKRYRPTTKNPGDSTAKRLATVLESLREPLVTNLLEPGDRAGEALSTLLSNAFYGVPAPESRDQSDALAHHVGGLVHDVARTQLLLTVDPSLYSCLGIFRRWYETVEWRYLASKDTNLQLVVRDIRTAILLLAKQGVTDAELLKVLVQTIGSKDLAQSALVEQIERNLGLEPRIEAWLRSMGQDVERQSAAQDAEALSADAWIATLMLDGNEAAELLEDVVAASLPDLELVEPKHAARVQRLLQKVRRVLGGVRSLATKRLLQFEGVPGDIEEFSPSKHDLGDSSELGVRNVKIRTPAVVRDAPGGRTWVRKAIVEKVDSR